MQTSLFAGPGLDVLTELDGRTWSTWLRLWQGSTSATSALAAAAAAATTACSKSGIAFHAIRKKGTVLFTTSDDFMTVVPVLGKLKQGLCLDNAAGKLGQSQLRADFGLRFEGRRPSRAHSTRGLVQAHRQRSGLDLHEQPVDLSNHLRTASLKSEPWPYASAL